MRILLVAATALLAQASSAAPADSQRSAPPQARTPSVVKPLAMAKKECRKPTSHHADSVSAWRDKPLTPRKLTELPPATSYMAVYRTVDGCEEPMTVAEYRRGAAR